MSSHLQAGEQQAGNSADSARTSLRRVVLRSILRDAALPAARTPLPILPALLGLLSALILAGCSHVEARDRLVIEFWSGWTGGEAKVFQALVDRFNREHPHLFVHNFGGVQDDTKTIRAITAGVPPDAFFLWSTATIGPLAANGALRPLDDRLHSGGLTERDFVPVSLDLCRYQGRLYALPVLIDGSALYWNRKAFREAGLDPDRPPRTPEEMIRYARLLTRRDAENHLTRVGFQPAQPAYGPLLPFVYAAHVPLIDSAGHPTADTPQMRRALTWYRDLVDAMVGAAEVDAFTAGLGAEESRNDPLILGLTAMKGSGEWLPSWLARLAPDLDYGVARFPDVEPDGPPTASIGGNPVCIPRESDHPDAAWTFISWLQTRDAQLEFARGIHNLPNRRDMFDEPSLTRGSSAAESYSVLLHLAASPEARAFPNAPYATLYQTELTNARDFVGHGDKTPEQAARDLQRRLEREARWALGAGPS